MIQKGARLMRNPLLSGSIVMVGGSMFINGINYFYHLIMGRTLGPVDYGTLASVFSLLYLSSIIPISTSFAIVKFISEAKTKGERSEIYAKLNKFVFRLGLLGAIAIVLLAPFIAGFLHIEELISIVMVGPILFLSLITLVNQSAMQGVLRFSGVVVPNFGNAIGKLAIGLALIYLGYSVNGAIAGVLLSMVVAYFLSVKLKKGLFDSSTESNFSMRSFLKYSFPVLLQALAFTSMFTVDLILAKHFLQPFEAGLYAALSTLGKIIYFAVQPITATMFPIVSGRRSKGESFSQVFITSFFLTAFVSLLIVAAYWLLPELSIGLLYGKDYLSASGDLVWMGLFVAFYTMAYMLINFLLSVDRVRIVILPLLAGVAQIVGIYLYHESVRQIIQVSFAVSLALFGAVSAYLVYNQFQRYYAEARK